MKASAPALPTNVSAAQIFDRPYRDANGLIVMCMYCRHTRRGFPDEDQWDWVEEFAETQPPRTSHGICKKCLNAALIGSFKPSDLTTGRAKSELQSIRIAIQTLACRLWFEKRTSRGDADWLVDGRLMDQLDALSRAQLLRVRDLLSRRAEDKRKTMQLITFRTVIVPRTSV